MRLRSLALAAALAATAAGFAPPASADHCDRYPKPLDVVCRNTLPERCYSTDEGIVCEYS